MVRRYEIEHLGKWFYVVVYLGNGSKHILGAFETREAAQNHIEVYCP